jgi:hypothetical protein
MSAKRKRKSRAQDPNFLALKACCKAMGKTDPRMRLPTLEFLWDKYIVHPNR